jgi:hypothetical protein
MSNHIELGGQQVTFRELFERHGLVEIPLVQRDYAQGRRSEREVRDEFLEALLGALLKEPGDPTLPLNLDFVYGSAGSEAGSAFAPLDGQQRLTTLFLLHWYLAWHDGEMDDFAQFICKDGNSCFTYAIRPSSKEFFDALVGWMPSPIPATNTGLSVLMLEQPWFFHSWQLDPTIQSALTMLDAIHRRFATTSGLYARLVRKQEPYITMHLLDLKSFGLSDDLYIKMNARGKPLTPFETFKARLEQHLGAAFTGATYALHGQPATLKEYFSHRIDTVWADVFWHYRDKTSNVFDERFMHLVQTVAITTRDHEAAGSEALLTALRNAPRPFSFRRFQETNCLDHALIDTLVAVLDGWSGAPDGIRPVLGPNQYYDEPATFTKAIQNFSDLTYTQLVQFHAYCAYIRQHRSRVDPGRFAEWMRVIVNLSENTPYNNVGDLRLGIAGVNTLVKHTTSILDHLASGIVDVPGFTVQQVREEQLKARLMLRGGGEWTKRILQAEQHGYFKGQIEFLLKFAGVLDEWKTAGNVSWPDETDAMFLQRFDDYYARATTVFNKSGLLFFGAARWERALLAIGDYLLPFGSNHHFGDSTGRDVSWKRLLRGNALDSGSDAMKRMYFKALLDKIPAGDKNVAATLDNIIAASPDTGDWREPFVRCPALIEYCQQKMIRFYTADHIYLLSSKRRSADHAELYTYYLQKTVLEPMAVQGALAPFGKPDYQSVNTDREEPCIVMTCKLDDVTLCLSIQDARPGFTFRFTFSGPGDPAALHDTLTRDAGFAVAASGHLERHVPRDRAKTMIDEIISLLCPVPLAA